MALSLDKDRLEEDQIFEEHIADYLENCNVESMRIWQYVCAEMLNNAIEHSRGTKLHIEVQSNVLFNSVVIVDDGIGTFQTLLEYMQTHGWNNPRVEDVLVELYKGKITSKEQEHSGEGIFFSSKMMDELFRVYAVAHPQVKLYPVNVLPEVGRMILHVGRGQLPENVILDNKF